MSSRRIRPRPSSKKKHENQTARRLAGCSFGAEGGICTLACFLDTYSLSRGAPSASWVLLQIRTLSYYSTKHLPLSRKKTIQRGRFTGRERLCRSVLPGSVPAGAAAHDLPEVPHVCRRTGGSFPVFRLFELKGCRLGSAVQTNGIPAPAVLFLQQTGTAAVRTVLQQKLFVNVFHLFLFLL